MSTRRLAGLTLSCLSVCQTRQGRAKGWLTVALVSGGHAHRATRGRAGGTTSTPAARGRGGEAAQVQLLAQVEEVVGT